MGVNSVRRIWLDGRRMDSRQAAFAYLQTALGLPDHVGHNLDALYDSLGEMKGVAIVLRHPDAMLNTLGEYGTRLLQVFDQAAAGRDDLRFRLARRRLSQAAP